MMDQGTVRGGAPAAEDTDADATESAEVAARLATELVRLGRLVAAHRHRTKDEPGAADRVLLARLVLEGERRATDLAVDALLDLSTVSRQVRSLVERGLVERRPDPDDRRGTLLRATDAGRVAFEESRRQREAHLAELLLHWPSEDGREFVRLLRRFNDDMVDHQHARHCSGGHAGTAAKQGEHHT